MSGALRAPARVLMLGEQDVAERLPMVTAIAQVRRAFALLRDGLGHNPLRLRQQVGPAQANTMWAAAPSLGALGAKLYPIVRSDVTRGSAFTFLLHTLPEGRLRAVVAAELLGQRRTGAASAVAAEALARPGSRTLAVIGAGGQAAHQAEALSHVLALDEIRIASRGAERRDALVAKLDATLAARVRAAEPEEAVRGADVVVTITGAIEPILRGAWLAPGTLVIAAGSNAASKRELDRETMERCDRIVVDDLAVARRECGDLLANAIPFDRVEALPGLLAPGVAARGRDDVVLFESHGLALQDLMCALHVVEALERADGAA
jgi:ornithine cyclodeaminase/alanine dehydrogenase-like protein (mu-crystallin family)